MFIGEFVKEMETTKETIRYYIDEKLLSPEKEDGKYLFTEKEKLDFENIKNLKNMGMPIRVIKQIKENTKYCGTEKQWELNLKIIEDELLKIEIKIKKINKEKLMLLEAKKQLIEVLKINLSE